MSDIKLQAARELIEEKRYSEARAILKTMPDDPTAKSWLGKLNKTSGAKKSRLPYLIAGVFAFVLLVGILVFGALILMQQQTATQVVVAPTPVRSQAQANPVSPTSIPSITPVPTDCGANDWWNYVGGPTIDFMKTLSADAAFFNEHNGKRLSPIDSSTATILYSVLDDPYNKVEQRDYPLCIKQGRDALTLGMASYSSYVQDRGILMADLSGITSEQEAAQQLSTARENMKLAASEINRLTGQDTDFLLKDGIS